VNRDEFSRRIDAVRASLTPAGVDAVALSASSDLTWLCGYDAMPLERITLLVVGRDGPARLLVPALEAPRVDDLDGLFEVIGWSDGQEQYDEAASLIADAFGTGGESTVAVADRMWAGAMLAIADRLPGATFTTASKVIRPLRIRKSPAEIDALRDVAHAIDSVAGSLGELRWEGRTEADVAAEIAGRIVDAGHERVNFVIVGSGPNGASPHHSASQRTIGRGDAVVVDIGGTMNGYCSDITRCVHVGDAEPEATKVYDVVRRAQEAACDAVRPGVTAAEVDAVARDLIAAEGYGDFFIHRTGHGIGMDEHEDPYLVTGNDEVLEPGMCFSIEPGVYLPGRFGVRLEDIVCVTDDGAEVLNRTSHDIVDVP
jgi:Xaa-Pro aminopeptidase